MRGQLRLQFIMLTFVLIAVLVHGRRAKSRPDTCVFVDHVENSVTYENIPCSNSTACRNHFKITYIKVIPYIYVLNNTYYGIEDILQKCCGLCVRYTSIALNNITELTPDIIEESDFIFPIYAKSSMSMLYGSHFLPYIPVPTGMYVTKNRHTFPASLLNCYPIVVFCLLMSVVSGFVVWLFETWRNEEEFPRPFLIGCFEGFWWAFISMTTVGYGDKTPKSVCARLYSVIWIMTGIIGFGILTGQLTGEIVKASSPPPPSINEKKVGVLKFRDHDTLHIVANGGSVKRNRDVTNFTSDVTQMIKKLETDEIDGFVFDKWTLAYIMLLGGEFMSADQMDFLLRDTTRMEVASGLQMDHHSYGILVRDKAVYDYFEGIVRDSQDRWAIISEEWWVKMKEVHLGKFHSHDNEENLFWTSQPLFKKILIAVLFVIALAILFGMVYELKRVRYLGRKKYQMAIPMKKMEKVNCECYS